MKKETTAGAEDVATKTPDAADEFDIDLRLARVERVGAPVKGAPRPRAQADGTDTGDPVCTNTCEGPTCDNSCHDTCGNTCPDTCTLTCENTCAGPSCNPTCEDTCQGYTCGSTCPQSQCDSCNCSAGSQCC